MQMMIQSKYAIGETFSLWMRIVQYKDKLISTGHIQQKTDILEVPPLFKSITHPLPYSMWQIQIKDVTNT